MGDDYSKDLPPAEWGRPSFCVATILKTKCPLWVKSRLMHCSNEDKSCALAAGARDDLAEQLKGGAIKFLKLHLLDRSEIARASVDSDARQ